MGKMKPETAFRLGRYCLYFGLGTLAGTLSRIWEIAYWQQLVIFFIGITVGIIAGLKLPGEKS